MHDSISCKHKPHSQRSVSNAHRAGRNQTACHRLSVTLAWRHASALTHPQQLLVLLLQLAFQVPHSLLDAPVTLFRLRTDRSVNRMKGQASQKKKKKSNSTRQSSYPKLKPIVRKQNLERELTEKEEWQGDRWRTMPPNGQKKSCSGSRNAIESPRNTNHMNLQEPAAEP